MTIKDIRLHLRWPSAKYGGNFELTIDFENYVGALSRKPRAFLGSPYFLTLPEDPAELPTVTTPYTPAQKPYLPKLDPYSVLQGGGR